MPAGPVGVHLPCTVVAVVVSLASYIRSGRTVAAAGKCAFFITVRVRAYTCSRGGGTVSGNRYTITMRTDYYEPFIYAYGKRKEINRENTIFLLFEPVRFAPRQSTRCARKLFYRVF